MASLLNTNTVTTDNRLINNVYAEVAGTRNVQITERCIGMRTFFVIFFATISTRRQIPGTERRKGGTVILHHCSALNSIISETFCTRVLESKQQAAQHCIVIKVCNKIHQHQSPCIKGCNKEHHYPTPCNKSCSQ